MTDLNGGAFFDAEFVIGHGAAPYRKGQVLHSVFAAAQPLLLYINNSPNHFKLTRPTELTKKDV
ncbi:hypothetical protein IMW75_25300 [Pseudomonas gregormendelii]|uniref:Uncharacterized protein n=2 Tax=Pseudomonas gregormendelii TaxID=1628277 RepID=A0ABS3AS94_9PSED|nr:hypothetical protein [Pseudomonas gregormendelii]